MKDGHRAEWTQTGVAPTNLLKKLKFSCYLPDLLAVPQV